MNDDYKRQAWLMLAVGVALLAAAILLLLLT